MKIRDIRDARRVAVVKSDSCRAYPALAEAPFGPSEAFPEWAGAAVAAQPNPVYAAVRQALADLGLDRARFGSPDWNPIGDLIEPGARVVLKPNWVLDWNMGGGGTDCLFTHAAVLRAVLDYVLLAQPARVVIGDAPVQGCDLDQLVALGARQVVEAARTQGHRVEIVDFRRTILIDRDGRFEQRENVKPLDEYRIVDLGERSFLEPLGESAKRFRVTMYDPRKMWQNHHPGVHRYLIAREVLEADLVVNLPKLKTHKKAGITAALKNLVGINGNKDFLPHHRKGSRQTGGDNYKTFSLVRTITENLLDLANCYMDRPRFYGAARTVARKLLSLDCRLGGPGEIEGSWYGNDTVWRMCLDLNRILLYADAAGEIRHRPQRTQLHVADAVVAGQGNGPLSPEPAPFGAILAAFNPAAMDLVSALLMQMDPDAIPIVRHAFDEDGLPLVSFRPDAVQCSVNGSPCALADLPWEHGGDITPPRGWAGHCELAKEIRV